MDVDVPLLCHGLGETVAASDVGLSGASLPARTGASGDFVVDMNVVAAPWSRGLAMSLVSVALECTVVFIIEMLLSEWVTNPTGCVRLVFGFAFYIGA